MTQGSPSSTAIRNVSADDVPEICHIHRIAFAGSLAEPKVVDLLHRAGRASVSLGALSNGRFVGHVLFSPMTIEPTHNLRFAGLAPVAILPEFQRLGLGSRLIREGLLACEVAGFDAVAVLGGSAFYSRFGFAPALKYALTNEYLDNAHFMVVELRKGALKGVHGLLKYAPEFAEAGC